jgi:hypothetical protein
VVDVPGGADDPHGTSSRRCVAPSTASRSA